MAEGSVERTIIDRNDPAVICGGVFVEELGKYVPVTAGRECQDGVHDVSTWEYSDPIGAVRAILLRVANGSLSPKQHIDPEAGVGLYKTVSGLGSLLLERQNAPPGSVGVKFPLPQRGNSALPIQPGDTFSVLAQNPLAGVSTYVLTTFSGAPFRQS